jgi:Uma2 family endonuclease
MYNGAREPQIPQMTQIPRVGYTDLKDEPEDGRRYEIYDGEVFVVPSPLPRHQLVAQRLMAALVTYEKAAGGLTFTSPLDIVFSEYDVLQPDVVFFSRDQLPGIRGSAPVRIPPALVVEVLSPSTESRDRERKLQIYARYAVPEYWIVDPVANTIEIWKLEQQAFVRVEIVAEEGTLSSATLPGLRIPAAGLFQMPIQD